MIVNREDCCPERIKGSDLYVGNDPLPKNNSPCNANPQMSGVFMCGGLVGKYVGMFINGDNIL